MRFAPISLPVACVLLSKKSSDSNDDDSDDEQRAVMREMVIGVCAPAVLSEVDVAEEVAVGEVERAEAVAEVAEAAARAAA